MVVRTLVPVDPSDSATEHRVYAPNSSHPAQRHSSRAIARGQANVRWTSKLGNDVDIEHELRDLTRRRSPFPLYLYGEVAAVMRRPRRQGAD